MFLKGNRPVGARGIELVVAAVGFFLGSATPACGFGKSLECFVDLPVYDAKGHRLTFEVISVAPEGGDEIGLLQLKDRRHRMIARGDRLYFPRVWIGRKRIIVTLRGRDGVTLRRKVALMGCRQTTALQHGTADSGADVDWTRVTGQLTGCDFSSGWWVRGLPMFPNQDAAYSYPTGYVSPADGSFWLAVSDGVRHILVFGRGNKPVKVIAVDVIAGQDNDVGTVDVADLCQ